MRKLFLGLWVICVMAYGMYWTHEHSVCYSSMEDIRLGRYHCQNAEYFTYILQEMNTSSGYRRDVFQMIIDMYDQLNIARKPMKYRIGESILQGHLDSDSSSDGRLYIYILPISFRYWLLFFISRYIEPIPVWIPTSRCKK